MECIVILEKREQQKNIDICGSPNKGYVHRKVESSIILKIDLQELHDIFTYASH